MPDGTLGGEKVGRGRGVCVAPHPEVAAAGAAMLRQGGNAFDAAVAAGFMAAVVQPDMCGIGGYAAAGVGFLAASGRVESIDADAEAPAAARPDLFPTIPTRDPNDYRLPDDRHKLGPLAVAVPGVLGGLLTTLERWGRLGRKTVMVPAIARAREGVRLTAVQARRWQAMTAEAEGRPAPARGGRRGVYPMPELAGSLEAIADEGEAVFYAGRIGRAIADHVRRLGGLLTPEDLAGYRARIVEPVRVAVGGVTLATPPPPSGGLTSLQVAAALDRLLRADEGPTSAAAFETFLEALKAAWEIRLTRLADPRWMTRAPASFLDGAALDRLAARVREGLAHPGPGRIVAPDPLSGTVHLAAADAEGNLVAWTQTHGGSFGAAVMVPGTGIVLGHGMTRFEPRAGWPNSIAPGKRPLHNMAPAIGVRDGRAVLAIGAAGGRTIVNNVAALAALLTIHRLDPVAALAAPRLQCETVEPARLERSAGAAAIAALRARGHEIEPIGRDPGVAHHIVRGGDGWCAAAEPRRPSAACITS